MNCARLGSVDLSSPFMLDTLLLSDVRVAGKMENTERERPKRDRDRDRQTDIVSCTHRENQKKRERQRGR